MSAPGIIPGGNILYTPGISDATLGRQAASNLGVFGRNPGATPKYALNRGARDAEYRESMARLFIDVPAVLRDQLFESLPTDVKPLARALTNTGFIDFLLTSSTEPLQERVQVVDTLTDSYVAFFSGQSPPQFSFSGTVLNTYQDDQRVWMFRLYRSLLRGTRLANRGLIARLRYDSFIVSGYLTGLTQSLSGNNDHSAGNFNFNMLVKRINVFTPSFAYPTVTETPATTSRAFGDQSVVQEDQTVRTATVTGDAPVIPASQPSASIPLDIDVRSFYTTPEERLSEEAAGNEQNTSNDADNGLSNVRVPPGDPFSELAGSVAPDPTLNNGLAGQSRGVAVSNATGSTSAAEGGSANGQGAESSYSAPETSVLRQAVALSSSRTTAERIAYIGYAAQQMGFNVFGR